MDINKSRRVVMAIIYAIVIFALGFVMRWIANLGVKNDLTNANLASATLFITWILFGASLIQMIITESKLRKNEEFKLMLDKKIINLIVYGGASIIGIAMFIFEIIIKGYFMPESDFLVGAASAMLYFMLVKKFAWISGLMYFPIPCAVGIVISAILCCVLIHAISGGMVILIVICVIIGIIYAMAPNAVVYDPQTGRTYSAWIVK